MKVNIVSVDDWEALYIDGKKVDEGHSMLVEHVLEHLGIEFKSEYLKTPRGVEGDWYFADNLEDVKYEPYEDE